MTPPAPCTGSAMNAATVSGPSRRIASSSLLAAATPRLTLGIGVDEAIRIGRVDVQEARRARLEHRPEGRQAGRAHRRQRQAVIGAVARDDLDLVRACRAPSSRTARS